MHPLKILSSSQTNEIDRRTIEGGVPGLILMENAAHRVVELLVEKFSPLRDRRIVAVCGRGNNGGDGFAIARQLWSRFRPKSLHVILSSPPGDLNRDAGANFKMLQASGFNNIYSGPLDAFPPEARAADLVIDAVLGTGVNGAAQGQPLEAIRLINTRFSPAKVVSVDIPSGLSSNTGATLGEYVRADYTVTFTAYKISQMLPPSCDLMGELRLGAIGTPAEMLEDPAFQLGLVTPAFLAPMFAPRTRDSNKGTFGHVLLIAGSRGKTGAAVMAGLGALRAGAGLVTIATAEPGPSCAPELMIEPLPGTDSGGISSTAFDRIVELAERKNVVAVGPGLGLDPETIDLVRRMYRELPKTMVIDADGLNALAGGDWIGSGHLRVLTPHPGEMARLTGKTTEEIQSDRIGTARDFASAVDVQLVLKGQRSLIASPDGQVLVNPTGSPAMATAGTGDVLTGLAAGMIAQFGHTRQQARDAVAAAVYLHGLAGELGARELGEKAFIATDLLRYLPQAIRTL